MFGCCFLKTSPQMLGAAAYRAERVAVRTAHPCSMSAGCAAYTSTQESCVKGMPHTLGPMLRKCDVLQPCLPAHACGSVARRWTPTALRQLPLGARCKMTWTLRGCARAGPSPKPHLCMQWPLCTTPRMRRTLCACGAVWRAASGSPEPVLTLQRPVLHRPRCDPGGAVPRQAALREEGAARARAVRSLRDSAAGLRAARDAEARLRADLASAGQQLAASRAAQVPLRRCRP